MPDLEDTYLQKIARFAHEIHCENQDGHGFDHIERVVSLAQKILLTEPTANKKIVLSAAYLHDTYDEKITKNQAEQKEKVRKFLSALTETQTVDEILFIIDHMSFSSNLHEKISLNLNGQIVQDADRLDAMGAFGIARTLQYGFKKKRELYNPKIKPMTYASKAAYHQQEKNTTINHFYEKLFLLKGLLNTDKAKAMAVSRDKIMHDFVTAIEREENENKRDEN
ncbi:HD domain-containing protein [Lactococcus hircilactis]|uniref:HD domain-containing protein n=1 Tax=Lactococcus hircilactis TaxID=1494462 RepID=A0A7X1Z9D6_9LACT|nr:HD domain-containing protein [Lactococcus hircilactis]MQW39649.1 HD domain-containing protein [Lactococcus hircilactis]